jgi:hypothetical protein
VVKVADVEVVVVEADDVVQDDVEVKQQKKHKMQEDVEHDVVVIKTIKKNLSL